MVRTPVEPALLQDSHLEQSEAESELYEVMAVGVAAQAELMHDATVGA